MAHLRQPLEEARAAAAGPLAGAEEVTREVLMAQHAAARQRRDFAVLGSDDFREAAEEVARIEIAIAALVEPPPTIR